MRSILDYLEDLLSDRHPIIACESPLTERLRFLTRIANDCQLWDKRAYIWDLSEDSIKELTVSAENLVFWEFNNYKSARKQNQTDYFQILNFWKSYPGKGILIVENLFPWLKSNSQESDFFLVSEWIKSSLINLKLHNQDSDKTIILLGSNAEMASEIASFIPLWTQELPNTQEIIDDLMTSKLFPSTYTDQDWAKIATASAGLYISDVITFVKEMKKTQNLEDSSETAKLLLSKKIQLLNRLYDIEFLPPPKVPLGGLELMQQSFKKFKRLLAPDAKQYNLRVPKGIMLVGPPGTGKSHAAKACSQSMGIPLIMVDWGNFRSFGNQAEAKLKRLLKLADRLNQVILYFDDFDKGFAGDDDLAKRLAGQLLTWMQERTSEVVVIASVNRMEWLPPELTRAGRFDYIFKVDLPNNGERYTIFKLHAARFDQRFRNGNDPWSEDEWRRILKATNRCVGAEIQTIVERAAASVFCTMTAEDTYTESELPPLKLTIEALLEERRQIHPLAIREADRVESMRNKADQQALPSSPLDESKFAVGNINIFS
ncbi:MAG: ATP-binding protein [Scytonema sp. PMC 1069.18]|nr:ATP-binding protein [Scytonema sp. PMC 1069.18]MEC4880936.1 ATP-binding protein [Scytonema sp. PMC 1070.18]